MKKQVVEGMTHTELVKRACQWLKGSRNCSVVIDELVCCNSSGETPDAIGFTAWKSILVECKSSREDFLKDKKKLFRITPSEGMGDYRFYMCPPNVIKIEDLPDGWGLLYAEKGKRIKQIYVFDGQINHHKVKKFETNLHDERTLLVSKIRRLLQAETSIRSALIEEVLGKLPERKDIRAMVSIFGSGEPDTCMGLGHNNCLDQVTQTLEEMKG